MLTSTMPPRATRTSHSISTSRPSSQSTITLPPSSPPRGRRPSISNPMPWLSRSSTQSSTPKSTKVQESKFSRSIELVSQQRSGVLGTGATVVRTPDEALRETGVRLTFDGKGRDIDYTTSRKSGESKGSGSITSDAPIDDCPQSPPLPPLPMSAEEDQDLVEPEVTAEPPTEPPAEPLKAPPRPSRSPPSIPVRAPSLRSSLKAKSAASTDELSPVPPLPANIPASPLPPPFRPILISEVPTGAIDPSKIIVTLDTCTMTFRTTLHTLKSRPSHLSDYLSSLFLASERSSAASVYSTTSDDMSVYRHHLASQGLLSQASFSIHMFLDRPSAPYAHILNYLRSPVGSPDAPEVLPRSVQLQSTSSSRLEQLLELRDEAAHLQLEGLHKLCTDEIRLRHRDGFRQHTRGHSSMSAASSINNLRASVYSLHTLLERVESDMRSSQHDSSSSDTKSTKEGVPNDSEVPHTRSPPTPQSWNGPRLRGRSESQHRHSPARSPPAGWI